MFNLMKISSWNHGRRLHNCYVTQNYICYVNEMMLGISKSNAAIEDENILVEILPLLDHFFAFKKDGLTNLQIKKI